MAHILFDTNIILDDASLVLSFKPEDTLIIPEVVLSEVDKFKVGFDELAFNAREFGRILADASVIDIERTDGHTKIVTEVAGRTIWLVSKKNYETDQSNDHKIIEVAKDFGAFFYSNDVLARTYALAQGVSTSPVGVTEDIPLETIKELSVEDVSTLDNTEVSLVDPDYKLETTSYHLTGADGNQKLSLVVNGRFEFIDEDELARQEQKPINREQKLMSQAICSRKYDIIIVEALSGSGKTSCALSSAMKLIRKKFYKRIVYVRSSVPDTDKSNEVGFLKGSLDEKLGIYFMPLKDSLRSFVEAKLKATKVNPKDYERVVEEEIIKMTEDYNIEAISTLGLRGRTLNNSIVIIDEASNISPKGLQTILTRIGKDSMVIVIGSNKQIDNPYISKINNGLTMLQQAVTKEFNGVNLFSITLYKVVRGKITEFAEEYFNSIRH